METTDTPKKAKTVAPPAVKNGGGELALTNNSTDWDLDATDSRDMVIPKILIGQPLSPAVVEGRIRAGDIYNSVTGKVLGSADEKNPKPVTFIPFKEEVIWVVEQSVNGRFKYRATEARTPANDSLELEFQKDGTTWRRNKALRYHVLLISDLAQPMPFPCTVTFMRTSFQAGKTLHNHFVLTKAAMQKGHKVNPADTAFEFGGHMVKNDKGTFYVYDVKPIDGKTDPAEQRVAFEWLQTMKTSSYKIDEADEETETPAVEINVNVPSQF